MPKYKYWPTKIESCPPLSTPKFPGKFIRNRSLLFVYAPTVDSVFVRLYTPHNVRPYSHLYTDFDFPQRLGRAPLSIKGTSSLVNVLFKCFLGADQEAGQINWSSYQIAFVIESEVEIAKPNYVLVKKLIDKHFY